jgi:hypothetical protein
LLTLQHPLIGDIVSDGDPDDEERALKGELPWIDDPDDDSNRASSGIHRDWVLQRTPAPMPPVLRPWQEYPEARPTMSEWRAAFEAAAARVMNCSGCGSGFYFNRDSECNFCDHVQEDAEHVLMLHYLYTPVSESSRQVLRSGSRPAMFRFWGENRSNCAHRRSAPRAMQRANSSAR